MQHDIARDVEDIDAVLAHTGSSQVFGLSSGAVITLEAAKTLTRVTQVAILVALVVTTFFLLKSDRRPRPGAES